MSSEVFVLTLRRRARVSLLSAAGFAAVILIVCALFPAVGDSIGQLDLGTGVSNLVGGGDFGNLPGYLNAELFSIYGPMVLIGVAISGVVAVTAREEEDGIMGLVLALPIDRVALLLAKGAAIAVLLMAIAVISWVALIVGVALAGGGLGPGDLAAQLLHLTFLAIAFGALAFAAAVSTGRRAVAAGVSGGLAGASYLLNGLAPLSSATDWLQKLSPFYYYSGSDPLANGVDLLHLAVLSIASTLLIYAGCAAFRSRDLRA